MGQSQSTRTSQEDAENPQSISEEHKVDFYELLAVPQDAPADEIKKAYKKKALELHPDKNYGNVEAATKIFAELQSAYQVLSDPQERSWYDSHRDAFLGSDRVHDKTGHHDSQMTTSNDILKLFSKFSPQMEFSDSPTGFYGALRDVFSKISLEERTACRSENIDLVDYPSFGTQDDSFEDVVRPFYIIWSSFSTKKSFAWRDVYRYSEAPDRRVRRLMEKENRRLRDESIRDFNEAVRSLVAFVKKRDPRYKAGVRSETQRQELLRQTTVAQAARSRAANEAKLREHVLPDWAKPEEIDDEDLAFPEPETEHIECIVCKKNFKSSNQFNAHERSKKHIRAIKQLRWEMKAESDRLSLEPIETQYDGIQSASEDGAGREHSSISRCTSDDEIYDAMMAPNIQYPPDEDHSKHMNEAEPPLAVGKDINHNLDEIFNKGMTLGADFAGEATNDTMYTPSHQHLSSDTSEMPAITTTRKIGKAKQKRARKAARETVNQSAEIRCTTCNDSFSSRTQLFAHVRKYDHAQPLIR